jgi:hypothetical protein
MYLNGHVYVLTAASRDGEHAAIRRFLDSVKLFSPKPASLRDGVLPFSKLKAVTVTVGADLNGDLSKPASVKRITNPPADDPTHKKLTLLIKPRAAYTDRARQRDTEGSAILKTTFSEKGFVPNLTVMRALPNGLLRQCVMAALRIKFLPPEDDGVPRAVTKLIEYGFNIYYR